MDDKITCFLIMCIFILGISFCIGSWEYHTNSDVDAAIDEVNEMIDKIQHEINLTKEGNEMIDDKYIEKYIEVNG